MGDSRGGLRVSFAPYCASILHQQHRAASECFYAVGSRYANTFVFHPRVLAGVGASIGRIKHFSEKLSFILLRAT